MRNNGWVSRTTIALCLSLGVCATAETAHAQGASLEAATDAQKAAAQKAFLAGAKAQEKGDHEKALAGFQESYNAVASPNSHLMVCRELVALGRHAEAYAEYEKTIAEANAAASIDKKYEQTSEAAKKELEDIRSKVALVSITGAKPGAPLKVRGREIPESDWGKPIPVMPGMVQVEQGGVTKEVDAQAGGSASVDLAPAAAAGPSEGSGGEGEGGFQTDSKDWNTRTWAYVAGGVGAAGLVTFGVFGLLNNSKHSKLQDECSGGTCPKSLESDADSGRTYQTVANVGLVVGVVGLGAGTVLYLMSDDGGEKPAAKKSSGPRVDVGYRSITVSGSF